MHIRIRPDILLALHIYNGRRVIIFWPIFYKVTFHRKLCDLQLYSSIHWGAPQNLFWKKLPKEILRHMVIMIISKIRAPTLIKRLFNVSQNMIALAAVSLIYALHWTFTLKGLEVICGENRKSCFGKHFMSETSIWVVNVMERQMGDPPRSHPSRYSSEERSLCFGA